MGEAKKRGSFEERKAAAEEKHRLRQLEREGQRLERRASKMSVVALALAAAATKGIE